MSNKLENYVKENKKAFNVLEPSANLWAKIESKLDQKKPKKQVKIYLWMSAAAAVLIVFCATWLYTVKISGQEVNLADINIKDAKKDIHFTSLIAEKKDSLATYKASDPELYKKFEADLITLDTEYQKLKTDLPNSPNQQFIVSAMVKNRELQLQILKQQLTVINQVTQYKQQNL